MEKLNIAEILKDCPSGMELDCAIYENVELDYIEHDPESTHPIHCLMKTNGGYNALVFTHYGCNNRHPNAKCVIFPKGKATWEEFQRPFKDGDVLIGKSGNPFIFKRLNNSGGCYSYCGIDSLCQFKLESDDWTFANSLRFATEEEKEKLFKAIEENGYKWNPETKTLEKLIEPKFKVGDRVQRNNPDNMPIRIIKSLECDRYRLDNGNYIYFGDEGYFKLLNFDITTLKPFDKVLVRDNNTDKWQPSFWGFYDIKYATSYPYNCCKDLFAQCIPYESNEHLLGTTNDCDEYYKTWE